MKKVRPYPNESDTNDRMTKKKLKELKVNTYTNKVYLPFQ